MRLLFLCACAQHTIAWHSRSLPVNVDTIQVIHSKLQTTHTSVNFSDFEKRQCLGASCLIITLHYTRERNHTSSAMKRDKSSSNEEDEEVSGMKNSDGDVKRPRMTENNNDSSSNLRCLRRSSRISQRTEKIGSSSTVDLNNCDASISVDNSKAQRNESDAPEVHGGTRSRVITEVLFSQSIQGCSSASNPDSAQPSPTLQALPKSVQERLMTYLDIDSLQSLSETCIFYDKYINGQFHLSIKFLFDKDFLSELQSSQTIVKKHVLRLTINNFHKFFASQGLSGGNLLVSDEQFRYLIRSQLLLLHTDKLREINYLLPGHEDPLIHGWNWRCNLKTIKEYSPCILRELFAMKSLRNVTKYSMILGLPMHPVELRTLLPNLEEISVLVSEPTDGYRYDLNF